MNLLEQYGPGDRASQPDGDAYFVGVDERLAARQLPAGYVSRAKNCRMRNGEMDPRLGIITLGWMKGEGLTPFDETYGAAVFHDASQGQDWILIAADGGVWKTRPNCVATAVPLPAGVVLTRETFAMFRQARGVLLLARGPDASVLECRDLDIGFIELVRDPADGSASLPNTSWIVYSGNRTWAIQGRDGVAASFLLEYTRYNELTGTFRINEGDSDALMAIVPFNESTLVMMKGSSIWKVLNATGDLSQAQGPLTVTDQYGVQSPGSVTKAGTQLYWQSELGIVSLQLTELNKEQATTRVLSEPLSETFKRLNGAYVERGRLAVWDGKLFWAFAGDDARMLGEELIEQEGTEGTEGEEFDGDGDFVLAGLTPGSSYVLDLEEGTTATNGADLLEGPQTFVAAGATVTFHGTAGAVVGSSVRMVRYEGINNLCAVYDLQNSAWCGVDESDALCVVDFLNFKVNGVPRLLFMGADGWLRMYEEGFEDSVAQAGAAGTEEEGEWEIVPAAIVHDWTSRGYPCADGRGKRYTGLSLLLNTWAPSYSISTLVNGVASEAEYITAEVRERVGSMIHAQEDWDDSNVNDDHGRRGRLDYSVSLDPAIATGAILPGLVYVVRDGAINYIRPPGLELVTDPGAGDEGDVPIVTDDGGLTILVDDYPVLNGGEFIGLAGYTQFEVMEGDAEVFGPGGWMLLGSGVNFDLHQDSTVPVAIDEMGWFMQVRVRNTEGRCRCRGVLLEGVALEVSSGIAA